MDARRRQLLSAIVAVAVALLVFWLKSQTPDAGLGSGDARAPAQPRREGPPGGAAGSESRGYRPEGPHPQQALPGGSLSAHEGQPGHTLARHVGRSVEQLRARQRAEGKSEVSTFPDLFTADRAVARTLFERREQVQRWLEGGAQGDIDVSHSFDEIVGQVLFRGDGRTKPARGVKVVLTPSTRFPEGFAIRTAYVRTR